MRVEAPFCEEHKNHWSWRTLVTLTSLLVPAVPLLGGILLAVTLDENQLSGLKIGLFVAAGVLFVAWLIVAVVLSSTAIRVVEITDESITLAGVHQAFVDELYRRDEEEEEEEYEERRRRRRSGRGPAPGRRPGKRPKDPYGERDDYE
jgi:hypothetical protein